MGHSEAQEFSKKDQKISLCLKTIPLFHCDKKKKFQLTQEILIQRILSTLKKYTALIFNATVAEYILSMAETEEYFFLLTYI